MARDVPQAQGTGILDQQAEDAAAARDSAIAWWVPSSTPQVRKRSSASRRSSRMPRAA